MGRRLKEIVEVLLTPLALVVLLAAVAVFANSRGLLFQKDVTAMFIYVVVVTGIYVFVGNSGVLSFGHVSFMVAGALATAVATIPVSLKQSVFEKLPPVLLNLEVSPTVGVFIGGLVGLVLAAVLAIPITRLSPMSIGLAMFAVLLTMNALVRNLTLSMTGGQTSFFGLPSEVTIYSAMLYASGAIVVAYALQRSRVGLRLRAAREDEAAARGVGVGVQANRIIAFLVSGFMVGLGGGLFALFLGAFGYDTFYLSTTLITLAMLVVGGIRTLTGAVIGTVLLSFLLMLLRQAEEGFSLGPIDIPSTTGLTAGGLAVAMLIILVLRPRGIAGSTEIFGRVRLGRRTAKKDNPPASESEEKKEPAA